jgi:hypothetical protein
MNWMSLTGLHCVHCCQTRSVGQMGPGSTLLLPVTVRCVGTLTRHSGVVCMHSCARLRISSRHRGHLQKTATCTKEVMCVLSCCAVPCCAVLCVYVLQGEGFSEEPGGHLDQLLSGTDNFCFGNPTAQLWEVISSGAAAPKARRQQEMLLQIKQQLAAAALRSYHNQQVCVDTRRVHVCRGCWAGCSRVPETSSVC